MQALLNIGVDVGKDEVVVADFDDTFAVRTIRNERKSLVAFLNSVPKGSRIGLEATGSYSELLADLAHQRGFKVFLLNPKDTRHYAKAMGLRGKTDRVDAKLIARYVAHEYPKLHTYLPPTPVQRQIDKLIKRRAKLTSLKTALKLTFGDLSDFRLEVKATLKTLDLLLDKIDQRIAQVTAQLPQRNLAQQRLQTIVGVGPLVGASLLNVLERIPFRNADAFIAFIGYDPRPNDSGKKVGRRRLSKRGPGEMRRLLFNAAMSAIKTKTWLPIYQQYRQKGLSTTATLVIIARRIARTAWSIYKHNTVFNPKRITQCLT